MSYEDYMKPKEWGSLQMALMGDQNYYVNSEPKEQSIIGFENRCVND